MKVICFCDNCGYDGELTLISARPTYRGKPLIDAGIDPPPKNIVYDRYLTTYSCPKCGWLYYDSERIVLLVNLT